MGLQLQIVKWAIDIAANEHLLEVNLYLQSHYNAQKLIIIRTYLDNCDIK